MAPRQQQIKVQSGTFISLRNHLPREHTLLQYYITNTKSRLHNCVRPIMYHRASGLSSQRRPAIRVVLSDWTAHLSVCVAFWTGRPFSLLLTDFVKATWKQNRFVALEKAIKTRLESLIVILGSNSVPLCLELVFSLVVFYGASHVS